MYMYFGGDTISKYYLHYYVYNVSVFSVTDICIYFINAEGIIRIE